MTIERPSEGHSVGEWEAVNEKRGKLRTLWRRIIHDKFGMSLNEDVVEREDGSEGRQFWIDFHRQAVMIFPLDRKGNIYLGLEHAYATNEYLLEAGGGSPNEGESLEDAARREVKEELGVGAKRLRRVGTYGSITSRVQNPTHVYMARVASVGESHPETGEDITREKMPFPVALELVRNGVITTGVVAASIWQINDILNHEQPLLHRLRKGTSRLTGHTRRGAAKMQTKIQKMQAA